MLRLSEKTILQLAKSRLLPKLQLSKTSIRFDLAHVFAVLSKLTVWELGHGSPAIGPAVRLCTAKELAKALGCPPRRILSLAERRLIPRIHIGKVLRFDAGAVKYALENLISPAECASRLGLSRGALASISGPGRLLSAVRLDKRCVRYCWPSVQALIAKASAKATVIKLPGIG